jgi:hypothetical protein
MSTPSKLQKFLPVGALGISLLLHLTVFLGVSGVILIQAVVPKTPFTAGEPVPAVTDSLPLPPDLPEDSQPDMPVTEQVTPTEQPLIPNINLDQITAPSTIAVVPNIVVVPAAPPTTAVGPRPETANNESKPAKIPVGIRQMANPFGSIDAQGDPSAFTGYMYDFKQTPGRVKTNINFDEYRKTIRKYVNEGWNDSIFKKFYKVPQALAAYQIFIPTMKADEAPAAFKAEKFVAPRLWVIVYKGTFIAPATGTFRFVGKADDIIVARIDEQTVLDGSLFPIVANDPLPFKDKEAQTTYKDPRESILGGLLAGKWFQLEAGKSYPVQVLIGEQPGGSFSSWLIIQKKGQSETMLFQMAKTKLPDSYIPGKSWPPLSKKPFISRGQDDSASE